MKTMNTDLLYQNHKVYPAYVRLLSEKIDTPNGKLQRFAS